MSSARTMTLAQAIEATGKDVYEWLDRAAQIPAVATAGCQGDVSILRVTTAPATTPIPRAGVIVVEGETGHTHSVHGPGMFDRSSGGSDGLTVGTLTVPDGADVLMSHQEHGALLIAPGTYRVGRQREFAGEWRQVAD
jgi:hypothetical protein